MYSWSPLFHLEKTCHPSYKNHCVHIHEWPFHTKYNSQQLKSTVLLSLVSITHCHHNHLLTIYAKCHKGRSLIDVVLRQDRERCFLARVRFALWLCGELVNE